MTTSKKFSKHMIYQGQAVNTVKMVAEEDIDFTKEPHGATDVIEVMKIPAGALVTYAAAIVRVAEGATCTAKLGDADDDDGWLPDSTSLNAVGAKLPSAHTTGAYYADGGKYYNADGTLILTLGENAENAKVTIVAEYILPDKKYVA